MNDKRKIGSILGAALIFVPYMTRWPNEELFTRGSYETIFFEKL